MFSNQFRPRMRLLSAESFNFENDCNSEKSSNDFYKHEFSGNHNYRDSYDYSLFKFEFEKFP